jgi:long-chain fatty acid transport protein
MKCKINARVASAALFGAVALHSWSSWAGGIWLYEQGTPDQGLATAGRAALAKDASTAFANPAGMTRLDRSQAMGTLGALVIQSEFETDSRTTVGGGGANLLSALPSATGFYIHSVSPDLKLGVSMTPLAGLALDYGDTWAGRYQQRNSMLLGVAISPTFAYKVNEWLSVGGGPSLGYSYLRGEAAINNVLDGLPDGTLKVRSDAIGIGGLAGILIEPDPATRFGVQYIAPMTMKYENLVDSVSGVGPALTTLSFIVGRRLDIPRGSNADLELTFPQTVMVSGYRDLTDRLSVVANVGWQNWSQYAKSTTTIAGRDSSRDAGYDDTWHGALGFQYTFAPGWLGSAGFAYDSSPVSTWNRTLAFPADRQFRYGLGVQRVIDDRLTLGLAYTLLDAGKATINNAGGPLSGTLSGGYSPNFVHAISLNAIFRF